MNNRWLSYTEGSKDIASTLFVYPHNQKMQNRSLFSNRKISWYPIDKDVAMLDVKLKKGPKYEWHCPVCSLSRPCMMLTTIGIVPTRCIIGKKALWKKGFEEKTRWF